VNALRIFFLGGLISYRALFGWLDPRVYIPSMLGTPLFQILFFVYVGRAAGAQSDEFYVVGNAIHGSAMAGLFGMSMTIGGERWTQTLSTVLATPANRGALFLGRAVPNVLNGLIVTAFGFAVGAALLEFELGAGEVPRLAVVVLVTTFSCTAFGLVIAAIGLRARDAFLYANLAWYVLLVFCGVNVALEDLPGWMQAVGRVLPLTHGIEAGREIAGGAALADVGDLLVVELGIGVVCAGLAYALLRFFEHESRRTASLETF
jgi:ABC-2 type transport system permease protein